jgi:hypothetical protein
VVVIGRLEHKCGIFRNPCSNLWIAIERLISLLPLITTLKLRLLFE